MKKDLIQEKLQSLPTSPGVYLMKDEGGKVIYVGKALNLRSRVRSYFKGDQRLDSDKTRALVRHIRDLEWILTDSEMEALILECNLIKKHRPKYNIRLVDDKSYPYLKITLQEAYPRLEMTRLLRQDGARYFGPYTSSSAVQETLRLLRRLFPLRTCKNSGQWASQSRPCLNAHIGRCLAPCMGGVDQAQYDQMIQEIILFLEGRQETLIKRLKKKMEEASKAMAFEKAAEYRNQLQAIEQVVARQKMVSAKADHYDMIHYASGLSKTCVQIFFIREGKLLGRETFFLEGGKEVNEAEDQDVLGVFLRQYYSRVQLIPPEIYLPRPLAEEGEFSGSLTQEWLSRLRGGSVALKVPQRGPRRELMELVGKNAQDLLLQRQGLEAQQPTEDPLLAARRELQQVLALDKPPGRMECYDISHISGTETVASMVVSLDGKVEPSLYRRFRIKSVAGNDDYASMAEVIFRRFSRARREDLRFGTMPDLVVIDGGKGQLNAALGILDLLGLKDLPCVGLAERYDWIYRPGQDDPLVLSHKSPGLRLLQQLRDEAHRFALTYHRLLRGKRNLTSALDEIPGLGPKGKKALLNHFQLSLKNIMGASLEALVETPGLNQKAARAVYDWFHPQPLEDQD